MSHVTKSIFTGATHIIPLADVSYIRKHEAEPSPLPFPDIPDGIIVFLSHATAVFLHGEEAGAFTRAWCAYRHEMEKDALMPLREMTSGQRMAIDMLDSILNAKRDQESHPSKASLDVLAERRGQIEREGYHPQGDDCYVNSQLAKAAIAYICHAGAYPNAGDPPPVWPWDPAWWKPKGRRQDLVRAAALLIAEIERIDRASETKSDAVEIKIPPYHIDTSD